MTLLAVRFRLPVAFLLGFLAFRLLLVLLNALITCDIRLDSIATSSSEESVAVVLAKVVVVVLDSVGKVFDLLALFEVVPLRFTFLFDTDDPRRTFRFDLTRRFDRPRRPFANLVADSVLVEGLILLHPLSSSLVLPSLELVLSSLDMVRSCRLQLSSLFYLSETQTIIQLACSIQQCSVVVLDVRAARSLVATAGRGASIFVNVTLCENILGAIVGQMSHTHTALVSCPWWWGR